MPIITQLATIQTFSTATTFVVVNNNLTRRLSYQDLRTTLSTDIGGGGAGDTASLQSSANRYLFSYKERQDIGNVYPKSNQGIRPAQGLVFPRPKIYRYGS